MYVDPVRDLIWAINKCYHFGSEFETGIICILNTFVYVLFHVKVNLLGLFICTRRTIQSIRTNKRPKNHIIHISW